MNQEFLDTAGTGRFELLLEPAFQCRVPDFEFHWLLLVSLYDTLSAEKTSTVSRQ
jgi:hypothetical protein